MIRRRLPSAAGWIVGSLLFTGVLALIPANAQVPEIDAGDLEAIDAVIQATLDAIDAGQLDTAEANLRALIERRDAPPLRDLLGVVLSRQERYDEAERELLLAVRGAPELKAPREHLGRLYLIVGRQEEALEQLREAAKLGDLDRELALALASAELASGRLLEGEAQLKSVADRFDSVFALLEWARSANERGDLRTTLDALGRALTLAPNSESVLGAFARANLRAGLPVPAIQALEPLYRMHSSVAEYPYLLGVARLQVGDFTGAESVLRDSIELDEDRHLSWVALGLVYNRQDRFEEAAQHLQRSLRLAPESPEALAAMAEAEEGRGRTDEAFELASRVVRRHPGRSTASITAHMVLGTLAMKRGQYEEARSSFEEALEADPGSAKAHYQLSLAHARLGNQEASAEHRALYQKAQEDSQANIQALRAALGLPDEEVPTP